jgi:uncharacterized protein (DUF1330 family)
MTHYFLVQEKVNDLQEYDKYIDKVNEVFEKYKGEYLAVDESPVVIEGKWKYSKTVIIKFNSKKDFEDWYYSEDYQKILKHRLASADCDSILIEGFE